MEVITALPIYRISPKEWDKEFEQNLEQSLNGVEPTKVKLMEFRIRQRDYYSWKFNDIIGWLELYIENDLVKAQLYISGNKKYKRGFNAIYRIVMIQRLKFLLVQMITR
ncbi:hypothetical protein LCY76_09435 [Fictibacillus sp. KIGAM418]|uniref:Uncharacterized protein n=1 Tax=Fictibacillus marinisediminis TaxID=2878389 RepID=A0A9X1XD32_9BACL|nr:hypothetical protein [Fictibacillus marinisediminis]MCK6256815.1 hypothetical protein [Fictibacillus marinisediminis]